MSNRNVKMIGIPVPVTADTVAGPRVTYGHGPASIKFLTQDDTWSCVTFEKLDSIRVCRGEYEPYPSDWKLGDPIHWVAEVVSSPWLRERHEYEKTHYGPAYEWTGDVDEMLRDFSHYVFTFHDQFVEVLAAGMWFEPLDDDDIEIEERSATHPLRDLPRPAQPDLLNVQGIACEIWRNARPIEQILEDAKLCSQKLLQFAPVLDGDARPSCNLSVRVRHGVVKSSLKRFASDLASFDRVAGLQDVRPYVEEWLAEIAKRRKEMGKL